MQQSQQICQSSAPTSQGRPPNPPSLRASSWARVGPSSAGVRSSAPPLAKYMRDRLGDALWRRSVRHANRHYKAAFVCAFCGPTLRRAPRRLARMPSRSTCTPRTQTSSSRTSTTSVRCILRVCGGRRRSQRIRPLGLFAFGKHQQVRNASSMHGMCFAAAKGGANLCSHSRACGLYTRTSCRYKNHLYHRCVHCGWVSGWACPSGLGATSALQASCAVDSHDVCNDVYRQRGASWVRGA